MRRFILVAILAFLSLGANAQITKTATEKAARRVASFRAGTCSLYEKEDVYYLSIPSTNRFDNVPYIYLGEGRESAIKTLSDLIGLVDGMSNGDTSEWSVIIRDREWHYSATKRAGCALWFNMEGCAGIPSITTQEMNRCIDRLL